MLFRSLAIHSGFPMTFGLFELAILVGSASALGLMFFEKPPVG